MIYLYVMHNPERHGNGCFVFIYQHIYPELRGGFYIHEEAQRMRA